MAKEWETAIEMLNDNQELANKIVEAKSLEDVLALLTENGVEVTADELKTMMADENEGDELSMEMLENVAGGGKIKNALKDLKNGFRDRSQCKFPKSPFTTAYAIGYQLGYFIA